MKPNSRLGSVYLRRYDCSKHTFFDHLDQPDSPNVSQDGALSHENYYCSSRELVLSHFFNERAMELPLFSIVIPCYNAQATLVRAVESCFAQSERSAEIILVDDASQDATSRIMTALVAQAPADMPVRIHHMSKNGGPSRARNQGWDMACGRYIAFLDADDCWDNDKLQHILSVIRHSSDDVVLIGHAHRQLDDLRQADAQLRATCLPGWRVLLRNIAQTSCVVVSRRLSLRFDTDMRFAEDHDLWVRIARLGKVIYLPCPAMTRLGRPQLSAGGLSGQRWDMRRGELYMYVKAARNHVTVLVCLPLLIAFSLLKHLWSSARLLKQSQVNA